MPGDFGSVSGKTSRPVFLRLFILLTLIFFNTTAHSGSDLNFKQRDGKNQQAAGANAPSYIDEPLETLIRSVPELTTLQPATGQGGNCGRFWKKRARTWTNFSIRSVIWRRKRR